MNQKRTGRPSSSEQIIKDNKRKTRKQYRAEEKIRIVLDGLRGEDSIAELRRREGTGMKNGLIIIALFLVIPIKPAPADFVDEIVGEWKLTWADNDRGTIEGMVTISRGYDQLHPQITVVSTNLGSMSSPAIIENVYYDLVEKKLTGRFRVPSFFSTISASSMPFTVALIDGGVLEGHSHWRNKTQGSVLLTRVESARPDIPAKQSVDAIAGDWQLEWVDHIRGTIIGTVTISRAYDESRPRMALHVTTSPVTGFSGIQQPFFDGRNIHSKLYYPGFYPNVGNRRMHFSVELVDNNRLEGVSFRGGTVQGTVLLTRVIPADIPDHDQTTPTRNDISEPDLAPPTLEHIYNQREFDWSRREIILSPPNSNGLVVHAADDRSGVCSIAVRVLSSNDDRLLSVDEAISGRALQIHRLLRLEFEPKVPDGEYGIDVVLTDCAGNTQSTELGTVILDRTPPTLEGIRGLRREFTYEEVWQADHVVGAVVLKANDEGGAGLDRAEIAFKFGNSIASGSIAFESAETAAAINIETGRSGLWCGVHEIDDRHGDGYTLATQLRDSESGLLLADRAFNGNFYNSTALKRLGFPTSITVYAPDVESVFSIFKYVVEIEKGIASERVVALITEKLVAAGQLSDTAKLVEIFTEIRDLLENSPNGIFRELSNGLHAKSVLDNAMAAAEDGFNDLCPIAPEPAN